MENEAVCIPKTYVCAETAYHSTCRLMMAYRVRRENGIIRHTYLPITWSGLKESWTVAGVLTISASLDEHKKKLLESCVIDGFHEFQCSGINSSESRHFFLLLMVFTLEFPLC